MRHSIIGDVANERRGGAGSFDVGPDGVSFFSQRQSEESSADVCYDAADDDLGFTSRLGWLSARNSGFLSCYVRYLDSVSELLVVPSIDFPCSYSPCQQLVGSSYVHCDRLTLSLDEGHQSSVGIHLKNGLGERPIRAGLGRGGHDDWKFWEDEANGAVSQHGLVVESRIEVASQRVQPDLEIEN